MRNADRPETPLPIIIILFFLLVMILCSCSVNYQMEDIKHEKTITVFNLVGFDENEGEFTALAQVAPSKQACIERADKINTEHAGELSAYCFDVRVIDRGLHRRNLPEQKVKFKI